MTITTRAPLPAPRFSAKRLLRITLLTAAILMVPLVAMQFTREVNWTLNDFAIMAILLMGTGLLFDLAARTLRTRKARLITIGAIASGFFFIWAELAVGLVGSPFAGS